MLVRFRGGVRTIQYISAARVLNGEVSPQEVQGKVIFVGTSAGGLKDLRTTPLASAFPGVEVHAAAVDNIIQGDYLHRPSWATGLELLATLAAGLVSSLLFAYSRAVWSLAWGLGLGLGIWYGAAYYMSLSGLFLSPLVPILALTFNFVCLSLVKFWREERRKRFFRRAFAHYVAPAVVERLAHSPGQLSLQGEEREATILFSDIRNFTSITESLKPQEVTRLFAGPFHPGGAGHNRAWRHPGQVQWATASCLLECAPGHPGPPDPGGGGGPGDNWHHPPGEPGVGRGHEPGAQGGGWVWPAARSMWATWARTAFSTIRPWATPLTWPPGWRG